MDLTKFQRLVLANQYKILEEVDSENADHYERQRKVFENGFEMAYDWKTDHIQDPVPEEECRIVWDILHMHDMMQRAYEEYHPDDIDERDVAFWGFDTSTDEIGMYRWTHFAIEEEGQWGFLDIQADGLDSHMPTRSMYQRMLNAWEESEDKKNLTEEDLRRIDEARTHPDNR